MQRPTSQSDAASAWTRRAAYGAPEAPVMPRKTRKALFWPFGGLEENRELAQVCLTEVREGRHRRALVHTAWAFEVRDLEGDTLVLRPFRTQVRRAELGAAGAVVGVAVEAAGGSEQLGARVRLRRQGRAEQRRVVPDEGEPGDHAHDDEAHHGVVEHGVGVERLPLTLDVLFVPLVGATAFFQAARGHQWLLR